MLNSLTASFFLMSQLASANHVGDVRPITLQQAISVAEQAVPGKVIEAELERLGNQKFYQIDILAGHESRRVLINQANGRVVKNYVPVLEDYWDYLFDRKARQLLTRSGSLSEMLAALERRSGGKAVEASFEVEMGRAFYEVELMTSIGQTTVYIDGKSGAHIVRAPDD